MSLELFCPMCSCRFKIPSQRRQDTGASEDNFIDGSCYAMGDGETLEDMIFTNLADQGRIECPACRQTVLVSEEYLGELAQTMLLSM